MSVGILALWILDLLSVQSWIASPAAMLGFAFTLWMIVDAVRREEWVWVVFMVLFPIVNAIIYYLLVYRNAGPLGAGRFELPGAIDRRRIKELEAQIHHLDKAHHHSQLGDIYFQKGNFNKAEACYRAAMERDPSDIDTRAHLGQTLLRLNKPQEALTFLEGACAENPKHDYGYSLMALAETYSAVGNTDKAVQTWQHVVDHYSYARARVELAELLLAAGQTQPAKARLAEAVADDAHAPAFGRKHERYWIKRARKLLAKP